MAAPNYVSLAEIKNELGISDTDDDSELGRVLSDASRQLDADARAPLPGAFSKLTDTRYYDVEPVDVLGDIDRAAVIQVDPLQSITTLKSDSNGDRTFDETWAATDYFLYPLNGPPYTEIATDALNGDYAGFPAGRRRVELTGVFGDVDDVTERLAMRATMLLAMRWWHRRNSAEGVIGDADRGFVRIGAADPDYMHIVNRLRGTQGWFA